MTKHSSHLRFLVQLCIFASLGLGLTGISHAQPSSGDGVIRADAGALVAQNGEAEPAAPNGMNEAEATNPLAEATEDTRERIGSVSEKLEEIVHSVIITLPLIIIAIIILILFWLLAKLISNASFFFRWINNKFSKDLATQVVRGLVMALGLILALEVLNATALVGATLGAAGVVGIAVAFAFQDLAENYIAGVLLSTRQPFAPNDLVDINAHKGKIVRLTSRATILLTLEGNHLRIPNAVVYKGIIVNYTRNPKRRFTVTVGVGVNEDLIDAQDLGISILEGMSSVLSDPKPSCIIEALGDSNVTLAFMAWVDQKESDFLKAKSEGTRLIKTSFDDAGIEMPEPIYRVLTLPAEPAAKKPTGVQTPPAKLEEQDTSAEHHIDRQIDEERRVEDDDLLAEGGKKE